VQTGLSEFVRVGAALATVVGLLLLLRLAVRKTSAIVAGNSRPSGVLEVLARYPLARGQNLILLKLARRILLLHQSGGGVTALCELTDANEVATLLARLEAGSNMAVAAKFRATLQQFTAEGQVHSNSHGSKRTALPPGDVEIIDLTRRGKSWFASRSGR
jgi:flagellar biogenesis protein FliO